MHRFVPAIIFIALFFRLSSLYGQELEGTEQTSYDSEFIYGINWNTNAGIIGGISLRYANLRKSKIFDTYGFEFVGVKHPKEMQTQTNDSSQNSYTADKLNSLFVARFNYGREILLFPKGEEEGVEVSLILAGGPSMAIIMPYYVLYGPNYFSAQSVPFQEGMDPSHIYGSGGYFDGLGHSSLMAGAHAKASLAFEFGKFAGSVTGIEVGFMAEAFPKTIIILPEAQNRKFFTSGFITLYFGMRD